MRGDSDDEHGPGSAPASRQMSRAGSAASPRRSRYGFGFCFHGLEAWWNRHGVRKAYIRGDGGSM